MSLNDNQKSYIKRNIQHKSIDSIALHLDISPDEIKKYLDEKLRKGTYKPHVVGEKNSATSIQNSSVNKDETLLSTKLNIIPYLLLAFFVIVAYTNSIFNDFVSDDIASIVTNPEIGTWNYTFGQPFLIVQHLINSIIFHTFGREPAVFRFFNIVFHIGSVWMVYKIVSLMVSRNLAFYIAAIFAVHPIIVESVTWISGGVYARYGFFFLCSFYFYLRSKTEKKSVKWYMWSLVFFILSLLSADKAVALPLVFVAYEISQVSLVKNLSRVSYYFIPSIILAVSLLGKIGMRIATIQPQYGNSQDGLQSSLLEIPIAVVSYLHLLIWPKDLTLYHTEFFFTPFVTGILVFIFFLFVGGIIYSYQKSKLVFFWLCFFIITLLPTLLPLGVAWIVAERYVYLGTIGIVFVVVYLLDSLTKKYMKLDKPLQVLYMLIILIFIVRTISRNMDWQNQDTLWISAGKISIHSPQNHNNLGDMYGRHGDLNRAVEEFKAAIALRPNYSEAHHNLGNVYMQQKKDDLALQSYTTALKYNPYLWESYLSIAALHFEKQEYETAINYIKKALSISPGNLKLYANLAITYYKAGDMESARATMNEAIGMSPNDQGLRDLLKQLESGNQ